MIYVATHKKFDPPTVAGYVPIQVGAAGKDDLGFLRDDTGDNISKKNKNYCELTGAYWVWKNTEDPYKGLVHYRRYFNCSFFKKNIVQEITVEKILEKYDVILPFEMKLSTTVQENYTKECGFEKDINITRQIIAEKYPTYTEEYNALWQDHRLRLFNMIIASSNIYDSYSEWLFDILFELERRTDISSYNDYQKRIFGFMSERLLNVYFRKNNYKIFQCGVVPTESQWKMLKQLKTGIKRKFYYLIQ